MAASSVDDDFHGTTIDALFGMEDVAMLVFLLLVLKSQDLGDNESGARIIVTKYSVVFIFIHLPVHVHVLKVFHLFFAHRVIGAVIIGNHGSPGGTLVCLVASALAIKHLMELVLSVSFDGSVDVEALGSKLLVLGGQLEDVEVFLKLDLSPLLVEGLVKVEGVVVVEA